MNNFKRLLDEAKKPAQLGTVFDTHVIFRVINFSTDPPKWKVISRFKKTIVKDEDILKELKRLSKKFKIGDIWLLWSSSGDKELALDWLKDNNKRI